MNQDDKIVQALNFYIRKGIITYDHAKDDSLLCRVWGLDEVQAFGMIWREIKGRFLGGGIHECYGYELGHNGQKFRTSNYMQSLRMLLNYVDKNVILKGL